MISPTERVTMIRRSLKVFICGLLAFVPVVGLVSALFALVNAGLLDRRYRDEWNPASQYLRTGVVLALLSIGIYLIAGVILALRLMPPFR